MIVCHDPGHGAPPAVKGVCANGIIERDVVLSIANAITNGIPWATHRLMRTNPIGLLDADRAQMAKRMGADLAILHHINEDSDQSSHGLICFYEQGDMVGEEVAHVIANAAPEKLLRTASYRTFPAVSTDWTGRALWCINHYRNVGIPCVLIEWGFASNATDAAYLLALDNRPALVACIAAGIARAMELTKPADQQVCKLGEK